MPSEDVTHGPGSKVLLCTVVLLALHTGGRKQIAMTVPNLMINYGAYYLQNHPIILAFPSKSTFLN